ncbi:putative T7SS-secreted protein [Streptomyces iconiensis]|uniref:RHS repeat-associated core domain-containing protein n=1 Tax=Streptomyces iconiensis TaxID=1384038 RepID=A0ABT7A4Z0_9ACTN|nr:RHS repeat-associated core domain-containing protein [Streptomyces iconiensis]MDJ1136089.1 RHS repeat-associated core domain-containing protein [Streptomyces iconiensis]
MGLGDAFGALTDSAKDAYHDFVPDPVEDKIEGAVETGGEVLNKGANFAADQMDKAGWGTAADLTRSGGDVIANKTGGNVAERELGETEEANKLIHGSPTKLRSTADHLRDFQKAFNQVGRGLKGLDSQHLKGETADAFRRSVEAQPKKWFKAADACEKAAKALADFSRTVDWAQAEAADAITLFNKGKAASDRHQSNVSFYNDALKAYKEIPEKERVPGSLPDRPPADDPGEAQMQEAREKLAEARRQRDEAARAANTQTEAARDAAPPKPSYAQQARSGLTGGLLAVEHRIGGFANTGSSALNFAKGMSPITPHNVLNPDEYQTNLNSTAAGFKALANDPTGAVKQAYQSFLQDPEAFIGGGAFDVITGGSGRAAGVAARASRSGARHADDLAPSGRPPKSGPESERPGRESLDKEPDNASREGGDKETGKDPVDFATGRMLMPQTDLTLPGVLPLVFRRQFESSYRAGRWFGPTWSSTVDQRLEIDAEGVVLHGESNLLVAYPHPEPGTPVLPEKGPRRALERTSEGDYVLTDPGTCEVLHFTGPGGPAGCEGVALLEEISDRNGNRITFEYDEHGVPLSLVHSGGYHVRVETDQEAGRIAALHLAAAGPDGRDLEVVRFGYDTHGNLTEVTGSAGRPLRFGYDAEGRITSWTDTNDSRYEYAYDEHDRCVWQSGVDGHMCVTFEYGPVDPATGHRVTKVTDAPGDVSYCLVNDKDQVVAFTDPTGATTRTERDTRHRVLAHTDALGRTTRLERDAEGRVVRVLRPDGTAVTCAYDDAGFLSRYAGPDGAAWEHVHDERGNRVRSTESSGATTHYTYDDAGRLTSVTDALGHVTRVHCDEAGLPLEITEPPPAPDGPSPVTTYLRDAFGRPVLVTNPLGETVRLSWTVEGKPLIRTGPDGTAEHWEWDGEGNCTRHVDAAGGETTYEYTHFDLLSARTGPDGVRYTFTHNARLRLTEVTNPQGLTWSYDYDAAGRLVAETDFDGRRHSYELDAAGQLASRTTPLGERTSYERDVLGRTVRKDAAGAVTTYTYDPAGRLTHAHSPDAELLRQYDKAGRLKTELVNGRALTHAYDTLGRPTRRTTPTGAVSTYTYDAAGNRTALTADGHTLTSSHDAAGHERERTLGDGASLSWTWDPAGRLTGQALNPRSAEEGWQRSYTYRPDGHLIAVDDSREGTSRYALDATGRVTAVSARDWTESYAYDEAGNQTAAHWPTTHPGTEAQGPRTYAGTRIRTAGRLRYEHDAAGRVTTRQKRRLSRRPDTWRYTWDAEDHLTQVTTPDGTTWHYTYDPLGRRIAKHSVTERVDFTWDGPTLIEQTTTGPSLPNPVTLTWNHRGLHPISQTERITDETTQREVDTRFFAIVTDLIGTPTALVTEDGTTAWHTQRTLWGTTTWNTDATTYTPLRFPGQYFDPETALHYNFHRHYDPETARYLSPDPLGLGPAPNPVAYVENPHTWADPLGLAPVDGGCPNGGSWDPAEEPFLYRGVSYATENDPAWQMKMYQDALGGRAEPRGGHSDVQRHVGGDGATDSVFTSWTTDYADMALDCSQMGNGPGVVLRMPNADGDGFHRVPGVSYPYPEGEVTIRGPVGHAEISVNGGPWHRP